MNILVVSQYFWPETFVINELVQKLKEKGHHVTIYTGKPNYPDGHLFAGYTQQGVQQEYYHDDILVYRVPLRPRKSGGMKNLMLNYASFVYSGVRHAFKFVKNRQFDSIFVFGVSPITSAIPGILLKWLSRAHLSIWVQDLWPESIQSTGYVNNRWLLSCVKALVKGIYACADTLLVQSEAFIEPVAQLSHRNKVIYYSNSAADMYYQPGDISRLPQALHDVFDSYFTVVFAGNIGTAQAVETIIETAHLLTDLSHVRIVLVGSGSMLHLVTEQQQAGQLQNVVVAGRYPANIMPELFSKAHALLVTLRDEPIYRLTVPCKVQAYLSAGKPIVASLNGEGARVLTMSKAAIVCPAENAHALADGIRQLVAMDDSTRENMGQLGRSYFLEHFEMNKQSEQLLSLLTNEITKSKGSVPCEC